MIKVLRSMTDRLQRATATDEISLSMFRVLFGLFMLLFYCPSYVWIAEAPEAFFQPQIFNPAALLSGFPPRSILLGLDVAVVLSAVTLTMGLCTRTSSLCLFAALVVGNCFRYSFGKIDHDILFLCIPLTLALSGWGNHLSFDQLFKSARPSYHKPCMALLAIAVAFGFFTAGYGKALNWVDFDLTTSGFQKWLYSIHFGGGRGQFLASWAAGFDAPLFWELADYSAIVFELGVLLAIWNRRLWMLWLFVACVFHFANILLLNIAFNIHAIVYLAFVPWGSFATVSEFCSRRRSGILAVCAIVACILGAVKLNSPGSFGAFYELSGIELFSSEYLWMSVVLWLLTIAVFVVALKRCFGQDLVDGDKVES